MIFKESDVVEVVLRNEGMEFLEVCICFSGEADNNIRTNKMHRKLLSDEVEKLENCLFIIKSSHLL